LALGVATVFGKWLKRWAGLLACRFRPRFILGGRAILRSWRLFPIPVLPRDFGFLIYRGLWRPRCGAGVERDSVWLAC
jgi:hypothetical protein